MNAKPAGSRGPLKIACLGGGPAGLYFALLMKKQNPAHDITVYERNRPYDTFGWGVVFSDETIENLASADPGSRDELLQLIIEQRGENSRGADRMRARIAAMRKRISREVVP